VGAKIKVLTFGSFMMDLVAYADRRPHPGETMKGNSFSMSLGGKGFNQAISAGRAGAESSMIGNLGSDTFGDQFMSAFESESVDSSEVERHGELGTGVGLPVVTAEGDNSIIIMLQSNDCGDAAYIERHKEKIIGSDLLLLQLELPLSGNIAAARIAKQNGVTVVLTPAPVADISDFRGLVDVVVPNESEAAELTGISSDLAAQADKLRGLLDCSIVVITLGARGAYVSDGKNNRLVSAPRVDVIDTVGAGDTLCANLSVRYAAGEEIFAAVEFAVNAASLKVTRKGSAMVSPTPAEVLKFIGTTQMKEKS